ncbi:MAG: hypothetical protein WB820_20960 [Rhodoplanes sp.]
MIAVTSVRLSEVIGPQPDDVDLEAGVLTVRLTKFGKSPSFLCIRRPVQRSAALPNGAMRISDRAAANNSSSLSAVDSCIATSALSNAGAIRIRTRHASFIEYKGAAAPRRIFYFYRPVLMFDHLLNLARCRGLGGIASQSPILRHKAHCRKVDKGISVEHQHRFWSWRAMRIRARLVAMKSLTVVAPTLSLRYGEFRHR